MTKAAKTGLGCMGLLFGLFVLILTIAISTKKTPQEKANDAKAGAYVACKNYVRNTLKSPSTADFPFLDFKSWNLGDGKYKIVSYVDAQNSFGAKLRMNYGCFVETADGEHFTVTKLENYGR